jgi:adenylosuccinate lyase
MLRNLNQSRGVVFSGRVLIELAQSGMTREDAYAAVQAAAMRVWDGGGDFATEILKVPEVRKSLGRERLTEIMSPMNYLKYVPELYKRCGVRLPARKGRRK